MKIIVTGASGFLGSRLIKKLEHHQAVGAVRHDFDISREDDVMTYFQEQQPEAVIHCAALSDVGACRDNPQLSYQVNVMGTKNIALACSKLKIKLVFCSSDQVYVGLPGEAAHVETEEVHPPHPYGQHKVLAENHCINLSPNSVCLRLAWMYDASVLPGEGRGGLVTSVLQAVRNGEPLSYPDNDYRSITNVWEVIGQMDKALSLPGGIYNFGSENTASTWEVAAHILKTKELAHVPLLKKENTSSNTRRNIRMDTKKAQVHGIEFNLSLEGISLALAHHL
ncbi:MAG: NAD(P)-dependent oxidoreductase [Clostridiales bacterium]|nr:NAD(P)-dependent oxidoreductase [Clostridiales bacterium]